MLTKPGLKLAPPSVSSSTDTWPPAAEVKFLHPPTNLAKRCGCLCGTYPLSQITEVHKIICLVTIDKTVKQQDLNWLGLYVLTYGGEPPQ